LAPPGKYDRYIYVAAAMRPVATIFVARHIVLLKLHILIEISAFSVLHGSAETRKGGKLYHLSVTYFLLDISAKHY